MMADFSRTEYEGLLYSLPERYTEISASTLRLYANSASTALVRGSVYFHNGLELSVFEYVDLADGEILDYSYSIFDGEERLCWFDPQPHPEDPDLAPTFPHHKHEAPDIKRNRRPAPGISFRVPNLLTLIADCIEFGKARN